MKIRWVDFKKNSSVGFLEKTNIYFISYNIYSFLMAIPCNELKSILPYIGNKKEDKYNIDQIKKMCEDEISRNREEIIEYLGNQNGSLFEGSRWGRP